MTMPERVMFGVKTTLPSAGATVPGIARPMPASWRDSTRCSASRTATISAMAATTCSPLVLRGVGMRLRAMTEPWASARAAMILVPPTSIPRYSSRDDVRIKVC